MAINNNTNNPNDPSMTGTNRYGRDVVDTSLGSLTSQLGELVAQLKSFNQKQDEQSRRDRKFQEEMLKRDRGDTDTKRRGGRWDSDFDTQKAMSSMAKDLTELSRNIKSDVRTARSESWRALPQSKTRSDAQYLSGKQVADAINKYTATLAQIQRDLDAQIKAQEKITDALRSKADSEKEKQKSISEEHIEKNKSLLSNLTVHKELETDPVKIEAIAKRIIEVQSDIEKEQDILAEKLSKIESDFEEQVRDGIDRIMQDNQKYIKEAEDERNKELEKIKDAFGLFEESARYAKEFSSDMRGISPAFNKMMSDVDETYSEKFNNTKDVLIAGLQTEYMAIEKLLEADRKETDEKKKLTKAQIEQLEEEKKINKMQQDYLRKTGSIADIWKGAGVEFGKTVIKFAESFADLGFKYLETKYLKSFQEGFQKVYDSIESTRNEVSARMKLSQGDYSEMQENIYSRLEETGLSGSLSNADINEMVVAMQGAGVTDTDMATEFALEAAKLKASGSSINLANEKTLQLMTGWYNRAIQSGATQEEALQGVTQSMDKLSDYEAYAREQYGSAALDNGGIDTLINTLGDFEFSTGKTIQDSIDSIGKSVIDASQMYQQGYDITEFANTIQGMMDKSYSEYSTMDNLMLMQGYNRDVLAEQGIDKSIEALYKTQKGLLDQASDLYLPEYSQAYNMVGSVQDQRKMKVGEELDLTAPTNIEQVLTDISETEKKALSEGEYLSETEKVRTKRENQMTGQAIEAEKIYEGDKLVNGTLDAIDGTVNDIYNILKLSLVNTGKSIFSDIKKGSILNRDTSKTLSDVSDSMGDLVGENGGLSSILGGGNLTTIAKDFALGSKGTLAGKIGTGAGAALGGYWMIDSIKDNIDFDKGFLENLGEIGSDPEFYRGLGTTLGSAIAGPVGGAVGGVIGQVASQLGNKFGDPFGGIVYDWLHNSDDVVDAQLEAAERLAAAGTSLSDVATKQTEEIKNAQTNITNQKEIFNKYDESQQKQFITQMGIDATGMDNQEAFRKAIQKWEQIELNKIADMNLEREAANKTTVLSAAMDKTIDGSLFEANEETQEQEIQKLIENNVLRDEKIIDEVTNYGVEWLSDAQRDIVDNLWKQQKEKQIDLQKIQSEQGYDELALVEEKALRNYAEQNKLYDETGSVDLENVKKVAATKGDKLDLETATKQLYAEQVKDGSITEEDITTLTGYFDELQKNRDTWTQDNSDFQKRWSDVVKENPGASIMDLVDAYNRKHLSGQGISVADVIDGFTVDSVGLSAEYIRDEETGLPILKSKSSGGKRLYDPEIYHNKFESGLTYVPSDDYPALLHEGERILTKEEAKAYNDLSSYLVRNYAEESVNYNGNDISTITNKFNTDDLKGTINKQTESTTNLLRQILNALVDISASLKNKPQNVSFSRGITGMNTNLNSLNT